MNEQSILRLKISGVLIILLVAVFPCITNAQTVSFGVTFGQPQSNNGPCVGKGYCKEAFDLTTTGVYTSAPEAVTVTFQVTTDHPDVLMMSFSLSELTAKQPDKVADFVNGGSYNFDAAFSLNSTIFGSLNLLTNPQILPTSKSTVVISGDFVTDYITYSHDGN
jgi:hypothetical protein